MDDIDLTSEEAGKLSVPLEEWTNDLKKRIEEVHARKVDLHPEDLVKAIDESMEKRPELELEVGNILKTKDETKVKQFFSKIKSSAKRLGHKLKEKLKYGWNKTKNFLEKMSFKRGVRRIRVATFSILDLLVIDPIIALVLIPFKGLGYAGHVLDGLTIAAALRIYDHLFKFHGDPDYKEKMDAHIRGHGGISLKDILSL
ncbi:uncharacterized protein LOC141855724 [Brevipalpus obovatus]|uniref:uncharacterized protein LOC141855724 n=1 Tax=Brevipalpus obovatus TaxID=246614 RepID=UPI003D9F5163